MDRKQFEMSLIMMGYEKVREHWDYNGEFAILNILHRCPDDPSKYEFDPLHFSVRGDSPNPHRKWGQYHGYQRVINYLARKHQFTKVNQKNET